MQTLLGQHFSIRVIHLVRRMLRAMKRRRIIFIEAPTRDHWSTSAANENV